MNYQNSYRYTKYTTKQSVHWSCISLQSLWTKARAPRPRHRPPITCYHRRSLDVRCGNVLYFYIMTFFIRRLQYTGCYPPKLTTRTLPAQ